MANSNNINPKLKLNLNNSSGEGKNEKEVEVNTPEVEKLETEKESKEGIKSNPAITFSVPEKSEEESKISEKITFNGEVPKVPVDKKVKVKLNRDHSCVIGGVRYNFKRGKQVDVPQGVKVILANAKLLAPL